MRPSPPLPSSARLASSTTRQGLIRPGHGSGSLMPLPIPCALAAWCLSPQPSKGRWSSRSSAGRSPSGSSESQLTLIFQWAPLPQAPPWSAPRQGSGPGSPRFDLRRWRAEPGRWRALDRRHGTLRGPAFARAMVPSVLLVHRHQWHSGQCTRIQPRHVERWDLSRSELAEFCGCPVDALRFSRMGPVHLSHGGAWIRR